MKKFLSVVLAVLMLFSCLTAAAYAADEKQYSSLCSTTDVPVVVVRGDGENIFDENGERAYTPTDIFSMFGSMGDDDERKGKHQTVRYERSLSVHYSRHYV